MVYDLSKYTFGWFSNASLEELESEREYVRSEIYCNPEAEYDTRCKAEKLLDLFDKHIHRLKYGNNKNWEPPKSTRHGWYLPDDDDD